MPEFIKKYFKNLLLVVTYTVLMILIYVIWFESLWHLWYVDFVTGILIFAGGCVIGYQYIKGVVEADKKKIEEANAIIEEKPMDDVKPIVEEIVENKEENNNGE